MSGDARTAPSRTLVDVPSSSAASWSGWPKMQAVKLTRNQIPGGCFAQERASWIVPRAGLAGQWPSSSVIPARLRERAVPSARSRAGASLTPTICMRAPRVSGSGGALSLAPSGWPDYAPTRRNCSRFWRGTRWLGPECSCCRDFSLIGRCPDPKGPRRCIRTRCRETFACARFQRGGYARSCSITRLAHFRTLSPRQRKTVNNLTGC